MDIVTIEPKMLKGKILVPPSKSVAHRAIISAFMSKSPCVIENIELSEDIKATLDCIRSLGAKYVYSDTKKTIKIDTKAGFRHKTPIVLDCRESGSTLRFFIPIAILSGVGIKFVGSERLMERPQIPYFDMFDEKGIEYTKDLNSLTIRGNLKPGIYKMPGDVSSQFITGLLFALPTLRGDSEIIISGEMESKAYINLTLDILKDFGIEIRNNNYKSFMIKGKQKYKSVNYKVESDYSQAAFFLVAGALGCDIKCMNLREDSLQGDKKILDIIAETGAKIVKDEDDGIMAQKTAIMKGVTIDAREIPDLVPILVVLCSFCDGESKIINAGRLRFKESDRLSAIAHEINHLGGKVTEGGDYLEIQGVSALKGETVSSWNDHRIAMSLAIAASRAEGAVSITGANTAVLKSYPNFFEVYNSL